MEPNLIEATERHHILPRTLGGGNEKSNMAIGTPVALGSTGHAAASTLALTTTADAPVGSLIFVAAGQAAGGVTVVSSCTDQKSNSYTALGSVVNADATGAAYALNTASDVPLGDTITVTYGSLGGTVTMAACAVSGIATSGALDVNNVTATGSGTAVSVASGTLAQANEIVFAILGWSTSGGTLEGAFMVGGSGAVATLMSTAGTLISAGLFTGGTRAVLTGDVVDVSFSVSL